MGDELRSQLTNPSQCKGGTNPTDYDGKRPPPPEGSGGRGLPALDINIPPPPCKPPRKTSAIERLEAWRESGSGHRRIVIQEEGYSGWTVCLRSLMKSETSTVVRMDLDDAIHAAIDKAEELGL